MSLMIQPRKRTKQWSQASSEIMGKGRKTKGDETSDQDKGKRCSKRNKMMEDRVDYVDESICNYGQIWESEKRNIWEWMCDLWLDSSHQTNRHLASPKWTRLSQAMFFFFFVVRSDTDMGCQGVANVRILEAKEIPGGWKARMDDE